MKQPNNSTTTTNRLPNPAYGLALIFLLVLAGFGLTALLSGDESPATAATTETVAASPNEPSEPEPAAESEPASTEPIDSDPVDQDQNVEPVDEAEVVAESEPADVEQIDEPPEEEEQIVEPESTPCIFDGGGGTTTTTWTNTEGSATSDATVVTGIDTFRFGECVRTVIELSSSFPLFGEEATPATVLPSDITVSGDTNDGVALIDFGQLVEEASAVVARFNESETAQSTFVYRTEALTLAGDIYGPSSTLDVRFDNSSGTIVIDVADTGEEVAAVQPLLDENGVIIKSVEAGADNSVTIIGYARPFEANLGAEVFVNDTPTSVGWAREDDATSATNGIPTTDWVSALGYFEFTIEPDESIDLADVVVRLDPEGGNDNPTEVDLILADLLSQ